MSEKNYLSKPKYFLLLIGLFSTIIFDMSFVKIYDIVNKDFISTDVKNIIFIVNSLSSLSIQFYMLKSVTKFLSQDRFNSINMSFTRFSRFGYFYLIIVSGIIFTLSFQMLFENSYTKYGLICFIIITYAISSFYLIKLGTLFYSWLTITQKKITLFYFVSICLIILNLVSGMTIAVIKINDKPEEIREYVGGTSNFTLPKYKLLDQINVYSSFLSFISLWLTSFILAFNYRLRTKRNLFFSVLLALPLIYFITNYISNYYYHFLNDYFLLNPIVFSLIFVTIFSLSKPIGGITFGILFWRASKAVSYEKDIVSFIILAGVGIMLVFSANQATTVITTPYPPFGTATISILNIATYLMLIGIYSSARLVSINNELRNSIFKITLESRILNIIGEAEKQKELEGIVSTIYKTNSEIQGNTEIKQTSELDEVELKKYIESVISELKANEKSFNAN